jgi:asparagine synthase (glutamine-hydrolysing)
VVLLLSVPPCARQDRVTSTSLAGQPDVCGIVAIVTSRTAGLERHIRAMNETLVHRGPDGAGLEISPAEGIAIAMRRLSILDIEGGQQPMWDESRRHAVVFNGEIYNSTDLRVELTAKGHRFCTDHSDTEVLVHGYEEWGVGLFTRLNGMFAFVIWDRPQRHLVVARDFTGEKPLYVGHVDGGYAVASELKALLRHPSLSRDLDPKALEQYLAFDFVMGPRTILSAVKKLAAGHYAILRSDAFESRRYWSISFAQSARTSMNKSAMLLQMDELLDQSVRRRMVADVPVGLFLSGGLDSTTVGHYMCRHSPQVESFSIGFDDPAYDESGYAQIAARHLGTRHHLEVFSEDRIRELVPRVADILDEPMADQSIFPTFLLSRFARKSVKVALGGDGADELLMGYRTYQLLKAYWILDRLPRLGRHSLIKIGTLLPTTGPTRMLKSFAAGMRLAPVERLLSRLGSYRGEARWVLSPDIRADLAASAFDEPVGILSDGLAGEVGVANRTIAAYMRGYLQEDILVKVDRASMAASLEVRSPFLDPHLIAFLGAVPPSLKLRGMTRKYLLRELMRGRLPDALIDRPKHGFGVPLNKWLGTSLAELLADYLSPSRLRTQGIFDHRTVTKLVQDHLEGRRANGQQLWPLLLFQLWHQRWLATR